tara:strand:- start:342 stop:647 length:306 start_codon:yes stop_codon:yes gene_type:complete
MKMITNYYIETAFDINGRLVHIDDVRSGKDCNCTCTKCKEPLIAEKNQGSTHHFKHLPNSECKGELIWTYQPKKNDLGVSIFIDEDIEPEFIDERISSIRS